MHGFDADFIGYQRRSGNGVWRPTSIWMIPGTTLR
jgi:hypothetical protein